MALPDNPLPDCPSFTLSCTRRSRSYDRAPTTLLPLVEDALLTMQPAELDMRDEEQGRIHAVFAVFVLKDDMDLAVEPHAGGSAVHVRSDSRVGRYDFGVNRRRVKRFFQLLDDEL